MYRNQIIEATRCEPLEAEGIEAIMRIERPTLDSLTADELRSLARRAQLTLLSLRETDPVAAAHYDGMGVRTSRLWARDARA